MKHIICLIFSIVIALAMSLHFSERIFAAESLPAAAVEEGEESAQREEALPEAGPAGTEEKSDQVDSMLYAGFEGDTVYVNTTSEEASVNGAGGKSGEVGTDTDASEEEAKTFASADAESEDFGVNVADSTAEPADAGESPDAGQSDIETADAENTADAAKTADAEPAEAKSAEVKSAEAESAEAEPADAKSAEVKSAEAKSAEVKAEEAKSTETGAADTEEVNGGSAAEDPLVKAGESVDPLIYLLECLKYHGGETDPAAFSLRAYTEDGQSIVTPVKDQTPWQTCWGFSAIASSETSILSECYAKWDQLAPGLKEKYGITSFKELCEWLDLSERQIAWFAFTPEPENGNYPSQAGEGLIATQYGMGGIYNALGGTYYATSVFARGTGPLEESRVPYQNNEGVLNKGATVTAKDGTQYLDQDYLDYILETRDVEYECLIPLGMTKEEVIDHFSANPAVQEKVRQRLEEGVITESSTVYKFVDDNGKYYHVVRMNQLDELKEGYPDILIFEDDDKNQYKFEPESLSFPGLPRIRRAYYDWSVDESLRYASVLSLDNSNILPRYLADDNVNEAAIKAIKDELTAGRAVSIGFCADTASPGSTKPAKYINTSDNIWAHYTYLDTESSNHCVTIVGYNDKFPRTLFLEGHEPEKDGAWLVKNSWGGGLSTGTNFGSWGIDENGDGIGDGYFWLSYWDKSIGSIETFDYRVEDLITNRMEYDIRQYDFMTTTEPIKYNSEKAANVFTAEMTTNVREIGVQNNNDATTISYEIYLLNEDAANPTDGVLLASGSEYFKYAGYHRIKTNKVCIIPEGLKYSVVVTQMREGKPYVSVFYDFNEQSVIDKEAAGMTGIRKYSNAVVNRGESYILDEGKWMDWVDYIPTFKRAYASVYTRTKEEWLAVDNFSIKAYADYISRDLAAEAAKIGSGEPASTVGVSDEDAAKKDALVPLALVHNEISNNTTAAKASSVEKGYISANDYDYIVKTLIDPDRATGLKVVVSSKEIADSDLEQKELDQLLEAADYKIARYADISLLVVALDTGEYLGSLHRTDDPIDLAIAIPSDVIALEAPVYVLRLHNGVVERLATTVRDGLACFASDLFSRFALGYQVEGLGGDDGLDADPDEDEPAIVPENPENEEPVKAGVTKTSVKKSAGKKAKAAESRVIAAETADVSDVMLWLVLMGLAAGAAFIAVLTKKVRRM